MKFAIAAALGALTLAVAAPALAAPGGWEIDRREQWMEQRIQQGARDGSLDRREYRRVQGELNSIRNEERRMRAHHRGRLDDRDRMALERRLDDLNARIHWLRSNGERAPWR
jgi:hypothetical protein